MGIVNTVLSLFGGGNPGGRNMIVETAGAFIPNAEASAQRATTIHTGAQQQYAAEFRARERKGWFNALVDGLNRLPRPAMTYGTIWLFVYAMTNPTGFGERMQGLALVPDQLWWLFGAIVTFYFGAREARYNREARFAAPQLVRQVVENVELIRTLRADSPNVAADDTELESGSGDNQALSDWRAGA